MTRPRVTVGLPVYNGAAYLRQTIESVLAQTYQDFELVVSDNAATDTTPQIIEELATGDSRIRVHRHPSNVGAHHNYNSIVPLAASEYFNWIAHDDLLAPTFLQRCVEVLDAQPEVVLAYTFIDRIDGDGAKIGELDSRNSPGYRSDSPYERLRAYVGDRVKAPQIFGLMRRPVLLETRLLRHYTASDFTFLQEMVMRGKFVCIDEHLFSYRFHDERHSATPRRERTQWFQPERQAPGLPAWQSLGGFIDAIRRVPMSATERTRCLLFAGYWGMRHGRELSGDLLFRARYETHRVKTAARAMATTTR